MPKVGEPIRRERDRDAALAEWYDFEDRSAWKPSKRKPQNIWRHWDGMTLVIFRREDGWHGWSVADGDGPEFSPRAYKTQAEALTALGERLGVGEV